MMGASGARGTYPAVATPKKRRKPVHPTVALRARVARIMRAKPSDCDAFVRHYIHAALWSTNDESDEQGGVPLDQKYLLGDIHPETIWGMIRDCDVFRAQNAEDIAALPHPETQIATDFWLTRNHHGCGFWDGAYPEPYAQRLTDAATAFGEVYLFCDPKSRYRITDGGVAPCIEHEDCRADHSGELGRACLLRQHQDKRRSVLSLINRAFKGD